MLHEEAFVQSFISAAVSQKNIADFIKGGYGYCSYCGGSCFRITKKFDREVNVLGRYPKNMSENESLTIHVWKYTRGIFGYM